MATIVLTPKAAGLALRPLRRHDQDRVIQVEVRRPLQEAGSFEPVIHPLLLMLDGENDERDRVDRLRYTPSYSTWQTSKPSASSSRVSVPRRIMEMRRRVDLAPLGASQLRHDAVDVAGREGQHAARSFTLAARLIVQVRAGQMFDRVPETDHVERAVDRSVEEVARGDPASRTGLVRTRRRLPRFNPFDAGNASQATDRKKPYAAPISNSRLVCGGGTNSRSRASRVATLALDQVPLRDVVAVLLALEIPL